MKPSHKTAVAQAGALALGFAFSACFALMSSAMVSRPSDSLRPSVMLITLDTVRADHLACYGYSRARTPNIDRLASEGWRFEHAYTQVPITLPAHAVILTGTYPTYNGVRDFTSAGLPAGIPTLAELLRQNGYHTAAFVSSFVLNSMWGLNRGFDLYDDNMGASVGRSQDLFLLQRRGDRSVDRLLKWLHENGHHPFFAWLHLYDAHSPYTSPDPYRSRFPGRPYDAAIAFDDAQVGRVIAGLREMNLYDPTVIVLTSDHGESLGEHGEQEHGFFIYNATLHVPLILKLGGAAEKGTVVAQPVSVVDIAATILELCGVRPPASMQGRSLFRLPPEGESVYAESYYPRDSFGWHELRAAVTANYKYIDAPCPELYDLRHDPGERSNLFAVQPDLARSLRTRLADFERAFTNPHRPAPDATPDPETLAKLRSLGYIASRDSPEASAGADPKDKIETLNRILRASDLTRLGKYAEADHMLAELEREEPGLYVIHFERAENYLGWGKARAAADEFRQALARNPAFDQAALGLGRAYFVLGRDDAAETSLAWALRLNPRNFLARVALARVYLRQNLPEKARAQLARVVEEEPQFAEGHTDYGIVLAMLRQYRDAQSEIQRGIDLGFRNAVAYNYLGIALANTNESDRAVRAYQAAIALDPRYAAAYLNLAFEYLRQRQTSKARACYQKVCGLNHDLCRQYASTFASRLEP